MNISFLNSLLRIYGVGYRKAILIISLSGISLLIMINNLTFYFTFVAFYLLDLQLATVAFISDIESNAITFLKDIKCYKGLRHKQLLPVRGQRTRTNAGVFRRKRYIENEFVLFLQEWENEKLLELEAQKDNAVEELIT